MSLNTKGIKYIHDRCRSLNVNGKEYAAQIIEQELFKGPAKDVTPREWARHLVWVIGFDCLIKDRTEIRELLDKIVPDE